MPQFFKKSNVDFIGIRWTCIAISTLVIVAGLVTFAIRGPNWSIDFRGGLDIQVQFDKPVTDGAVRAALAGTNVDEVKTISGIGEKDELSLKVKAT